jgi:hypothetical protein
MEEYWFTQQATTVLQSRNSMRVITVISGTLVVISGNVSTVVVEGTTVLLPFVLKDVVISGDVATRVIITFIPDLKEDIIHPLAARKIIPGQIMALGGNGRNNDLKCCL